MENWILSIKAYKNNANTMININVFIDKILKGHVHYSLNLFLTTLCFL